MNNNLNKLTALFMQFPGIGPRQAKRFAYFLAGKDEKYVVELGKMIMGVKSNIKQCPSCFRFYDAVEGGKECNICLSKTRNSFLLMVVEKDADLENIEKTGVYNGKYFVLGGTISLENGNENNVRLRQLLESAKKQKPKEIILALSATVEGDSTARYAEKILELEKIKITRLGRGLSTGTELEFSDSQTLKSALETRK